MLLKHYITILPYHYNIFRPPAINATSEIGACIMARMLWKSTKQALRSNSHRLIVGIETGTTPLQQSSTLSQHRELPCSIARVMDRLEVGIATRPAQHHCNTHRLVAGIETCPATLQSASRSAQQHCNCYRLIVGLENLITSLQQSSTHSRHRESSDIFATIIVS